MRAPVSPLSRVRAEKGGEHDLRCTQRAQARGGRSTSNAQESKNKNNFSKLLARSYDLLFGYHIFCVVILNSLSFCYKGDSKKPLDFIVRSIKPSVIVSHKLCYDSSIDTWPASRHRTQIKKGDKSPQIENFTADKTQRPFRRQSITSSSQSNDSKLDATSCEAFNHMNLPQHMTQVHIWHHKNTQCESSQPL